MLQEAPSFLFVLLNCFCKIRKKNVSLQQNNVTYRHIDVKQKGLKKMKQYLLMLSMLLTLSISGMQAQGKHRSHQQTATTIAVTDTAKQGVEAYSDTTTVIDTDTINVVDDNAAYANSDDDENWDSDPFTFWNKNIGWNIGGIFLAIFVITIVFLFFALPFIIIIVLLRYLIKRHNDRVDIAQQAIASGQPIPEDVKPTAARNSDYLWKGGITHIATGTGLVIMFSIWGSNTLIGIGCLLICFGIGQLVIAKTSRKDNDKIE